MIDDHFVLACRSHSAEGAFLFTAFIDARSQGGELVADGSQNPLALVVLDPFEFLGGIALVARAEGAVGPVNAAVTFAPVGSVFIGLSGSGF